MAQTALIRAFAAILLIQGAIGLLYDPPPTAIRYYLNEVPPDDLQKAASSVPSLESLPLLDDLDVAGRHRWILPLPWPESRAGAERLESALKDLGIHDDVSRILQERLQQAQRQTNETVGTESGALAERLRDRALGLQSVLQPTRDSNIDAIRVARSTSALSLLGWNSGAYSVARTTHFTISSQAGERPTAEMAQACELAYRVWSQLFAPYLGSEQIDAPKSDGGSSGGGAPAEPFRVVMFRTRDAYVKALRAIEPNIGVSTGYYSPRHRMSFFYWDGSKSFPTLVHELTHQFFQEANGNNPAFDPDSDPGFWAIEGVALYVESLSIQKVGGAAVIDVGGWDAPRLQASRYRRLHDEYWVPWEEFSQLTGTAFRKSPEIAAWYSQACGLVHRWMDGSPEDAARFVSYLEAVYAGQGATAAGELAQGDDEMRSSYDRYLMESWQSERGDEARPFFPNRREVVLSRCEVTSADLLAWPARGRGLDWLDLSFTVVDDRWIMEAGEPAWQIVRLNLESTAMTDRSMAAIAGMSELRELDLTGCKITDQGVAALQGHTNLRQLWLGQTQVGDESIKVLLSLPRLERLNVEGSRITEAGMKRILAKKPYLKR